MTTLYKEVLIDSEELAESMPDGTVAFVITGGIKLTASRVIIDGRDHGWRDFAGFMSHRHVLGYTAFVAVEAEEEIRAPHPDMEYQRRFVTSWEDV